MKRLAADSPPGEERESRFHRCETVNGSAPSQPPAGIFGCLPVVFPASLLDADIAGLQAKHIYAIMKRPLIFVRAARLPSAANEMILRKDL